MKPPPAGFAAIHLVTSQVMSLWPDSTVGTWNDEPEPTGVFTFGLRWWNSGSSKRVSGLPSTAPSQPMSAGGFPWPQPSLSKS